MRIVIETVKHAEQRYDTVGDWQYDTTKDEMLIRVSEMGHWKFNFLVALHELVEWAICRDDGVTDKEVDTFDIHYAGSCDEPGDDLDAPYWYGHQVASGIERSAAAAMRVNWTEYNRRIQEL
jgi:hypothetical protein